MNAIKNLPTPVQIAIPVALALILGVLLWATAFRQPAPVEVIKTRDVDLYRSAKDVLRANGIEHHQSAAKANFILTVPAGDDATDAATALAASGIKDRTGMAKEIECPAPPGFTATKAASERSVNCEDAKDVQGMLLAAGAIAANVKVSQQENGTLLGPEKSKNVVAQVFLPSRMQDSWNAEQAARAISGSVGTSLDRISITDSQLQSLFDGSSSGSAMGTLASNTGSATGGLGCTDIASATEVETKRTAVRACKEQSIGSKLTKLLGGSDRYVLTVEPTIDSTAVQTTQVNNTKGPETSRSSQSGSGQSVEDVTTPANTTERTVINPAGDIKSLRISVILDRNVVTADQKNAVVTLLASEIDAKRGDPAPLVKFSAFANGGGQEANNDELKEIREQAEAKGADGAMTAANGAVFETRSKTPLAMMILMGALAVTTLGAVLLLWRRSSAMSAKERHLQSAFSEEQRLFENFTQQNPDALVNDLNALFGAPSAQEPLHHN